MAVLPGEQMFCFVQSSRYVHGGSSRGRLLPISHGSGGSSGWSHGRCLSEGRCPQALWPRCGRPLPEEMDLPRIQEFLLLAFLLLSLSSGQHW